MLMLLLTGPVQTRLTLQWHNVARVGTCEIPVRGEVAAHYCTPTGRLRGVNYNSVESPNYFLDS